MHVREVARMYCLENRFETYLMHSLCILLGTIHCVSRIDWFMAQ